MTNELGNMDESLIHATSLKRKVSNDLESYGETLMLPSFQKVTDLFEKKKKDYVKHDLNPQINEKSLILIWDKFYNLIVRR